MTDILAPETLSRIDAFYDTTLKPKLDAVDEWRRQVQWLIIKAMAAILPPIAFLIAGDLLDSVLPFISGAGTVLVGWLWLAGGVIFALTKCLMPGIVAYANYRSRFKQDIVASIFKMVCPSAVYDPLQGIAPTVFETPGLFNTRGSFQSDDRVRGHIGQTPFEVSEVGRAYQTGSGKHTHHYLVFRGLFFHLEFNRPLRGVILIDPERAQGHQLGSREGLPLVTLDDVAFEKEFKVHASDETEARAILNPAMTGALLTLRRIAEQPVFVAFKGQRVYVAVHYGRPLFEPGIARSMSKDDVREIAAHFALVETIVRELNLNARAAGTTAGESPLYGPDVAPNPLLHLATEKAGTMTTDELWAAAASAIDDSAKDGKGLMPRPEGTRIRVNTGLSGISITYGLRFGFWVTLAISLAGALLAVSALRAEDAPLWAGVVSTWARRLPSVAWLDRFAADAPTPWLIVGTIVALLFALAWTNYVRRVDVDANGIRVYRAFRPLPRVYRRPPYERVMRTGQSLFIARSGALRLKNPTASPTLTVPEARWLASEINRTLQQS